MSKKIISLAIFFLILINLSFLVSAECTDSDGGRNHNTKGTTIGAGQSGTSYEAEDMCITDYLQPRELTEHFCDANGYHTFEIYKCPNGCENGACVTSETKTCVDSDDGTNNQLKGTVTRCENNNCITKEDKCIDDPYYNLEEYYCDRFELKSTKYGCPNGCQNGKCIPECVENWQCGSWSACINNQQIRTCNDLNNCGTFNTKPTSSSSCNIGSGGSGGGGSATQTGGTAPSTLGGGGGGSTTTSQCEKFYNCSDGSRIKECETVTHYDIQGNVIGGGCVCKKNPSSLCPTQNISSAVYFKSCSYIWDSSPHINQTIKITASINDSSGAIKSDSVDVKVIGNVTSIGGGGYSMDRKTLDIKITQPASGEISAGAVEIKIFSEGPNKLGDISLSFRGDNWGAGSLISNRNCAAGSGGGAGSMSNICDKYYRCPNGSEIQYCFTHKIYNEKGELIGAGCKCKSDPDSLCIPQTSKELKEFGQPTSIISSERVSGIGTNETPIMCDGCVLGNKCVQIGYRQKGGYCEISGEFKQQLSSDTACDNNFECQSNVCVNGKCISGGLIQQILNWLKKFFGM